VGLAPLPTTRAAGARPASHAAGAWPAPGVPPAWPGLTAVALPPLWGSAAERERERSVGEGEREC